MSGGQPQLQPSFSVHMEMGRGAATWSGDGISFKQEIPVTRRVGFEVISYNTQLHAVTVCDAGCHASQDCISHLHSTSMTFHSLIEICCHTRHKAAKTI